MFFEYDKQLKFLIFFVLLPPVFTGFFPGKITVITALCYYIVTLGLYRYRKYITFENIEGVVAVKMFLFFGAVTYIRGFTNIDDNADIYSLASSLAFTSFLFPIILLLSTPHNVFIIWKSYVMIGIPMNIICFFFPPTDAAMTFQHNMLFISGFVLCSPYLKKKYLILFFLLSLFLIFADLDRRSIMLCFSVPFIILLFRGLLSYNFFKRSVFYITFIIPTILLILGFSGKFNVFEYIAERDELVVAEDVRAINTDSRTAIYLDVFGELDRQEAYLFGLGGNGKTATSLVDCRWGDFDVVYKNGRAATESGMLNFIQYGGVFGWLCYTFLFVAFVYNGLFKSKNQFVMLISIVACFHYIYSYIEDKYTVNPHTFYFMIMYGICLNKEFLNMNDEDMKCYLRSIFH